MTRSRPRPAHEDGTRAVRRLVAAHAGMPAPREVVALGRGCDHVAYLVDRRLVVRFAAGTDAAQRAAEVEREARLLDTVAEISPLPVPRPVFVVPEEGCFAYERLPGAPLLHVPPPLRAAGAATVAGPLGRLLGALHATAPQRVAHLVEVDQTQMEAWLGEAAAHYANAVSAIPTDRRRAVEAFLEAPVPPAADERVFSHNDLGIEHVIVRAPALEVTGVIDWSDAALVDPARDLGLLHRDLGAAAVDAALAASDRHPGEHAALRARALFYARCGLLEDLAFGLRSERPEYVDKSLIAFGWLFPRAEDGCAGALVSARRGR